MRCFRWGSGRDATIGMAFVLGGSVISELLAGDVGDAIASVPFLLLPGAIGATVRYRASSRLREREQITLREREQLARELHDTVAHHVSAIAIRAQAGRALAASRPGAAVEALEVIEDAASRTLTELRAIVGALRDGDEAELDATARRRRHRAARRGHRRTARGRRALRRPRRPPADGRRRDLPDRAGVDHERDQARAPCDADRGPRQRRGRLRAPRRARRRRRRPRARRRATASPA